MTKISDALTYGLTIRESENDGSDFTNPIADYRRLFLGEDGSLHLKSSAGTVTAIGGAGDITTDAAWAAKGDLIVGTNNNTAAVLTAGSNGKVLMAASGEATGLKWETPAAGGTAEHAYYQNLAALLEPDALSHIYKATGAGELVAAAASTKWLLSAWACSLGGTTGRFDFREPGIGPIPIYNKAIHGLASGATVMLLDPALPDFGGAAREAYFDRLAAITTMEMLYVPIEAAATKAPWVPGPYGSIILGFSVHDLAWLALVPPAGPTSALTIHNEKGDSASSHLDAIRFSQRLYLPASKRTAIGLISGSSYGNVDNPEGGILYVNLPADWSAVADTNTYIARADLLTRSIAGWDVATEGTGSIGIYTPTGGDSQAAVAIKGNGSTWKNGFQHTTAFDLAASRTVEWYIRLDDTANENVNVMVGIGDGGTFAGDTTLEGDMAYAVDFTNSGIGVRRLYVFEGGSSRGIVGPNPGYSGGSMYRVKIVLAADGSADYFIQGGPEHPAIGSATWTDITPGTSANAQTTGFKLACIVNGSYTNLVADGKCYDPA